MSEKPKRYSVEWRTGEYANVETHDLSSLPAAKRLAREVSGTVWERPNIRPRVTDDGIELWEWDDERMVYAP